MKSIHRMGIALAVTLAITTISFGQTVVVNLTGATLYDSTGSPLADGKLVQLIASTTDTSFGTPTTTGFVSGDDVVLASFALDSSIVGLPGSFQEVVSINFEDFADLSAGDPLMLQWFDIAYASALSGPGAAHYGQFRTDDIVDDSDSGWFLPGLGSTSLNFVTSNNGGSQLESLGATAFTTAIPEPGNIVLLAALSGLAATIFVRRRGFGLIIRDHHK